VEGVALAGGAAVVGAVAGAVRVSVVGAPLTESGEAASSELLPVSNASTRPIAVTAPTASRARIGLRRELEVRVCMAESC
jgi:hypothetical protein